MWHVGLPSRGWAPLHELRVRAGAEPPPQPRPLPSAMLPARASLLSPLRPLSALPLSALLPARPGSVRGGGDGAGGDLRRSSDS